MTLYIGVDFHPHQQPLAWCDSVTGETDSLDLLHDDLEKVREFYASLDQPAVVGIKASCRVKLSIMLRDNISAQEFDRRGRTVGDARRSAGSEMTVA